LLSYRLGWQAESAEFVKSAEAGLAVSYQQEDVRVILSAAKNLAARCKRQTLRSAQDDDLRDAGLWLKADS
jgi:hypothetical protein